MTELEKTWDAVLYLDTTPAIELLSRNPSFVHARDSQEDTLLHVAAGNASRELVDVLLDAGADINARNFGGFTPLHEACRYGQRDVVTQFLDRGASITLRASDGRTPLIMCVPKYKDVAVELVKRDAQVDLYTGLFLGQREQIKLALHNTPELAGAIPVPGLFFFDALLENDLELLEIVTHTFPVSRLAEIIGNPLLRACEHPGIHPNVIKWLIEQGANPCEGDSCGETPLLKARKINNDEVIRFLENLG